MASVAATRPRPVRPAADPIGALVPRRVVRRKATAAPARRRAWWRGRWRRLPVLLTLLAFGLASDAFLTVRFGPPVPAPRGVGLASWYGPGFYGRRTAAGVLFTGAAMTAAHRSLPLGTRVRVTNLGNGKRAVVVIDDRGPYVGGRMIDLSPAAARRLGMVGAGVIKVRVDVLR
jgi:3D (Asp-Asp-Asp) domain-containing protein